MHLFETQRMTYVLHGCRHVGWATAHPGKITAHPRNTYRGLKTVNVEGLFGVQHDECVGGLSVSVTLVTAVTAKMLWLEMNRQTYSYTVCMQRERGRGEVVMMTSNSISLYLGNCRRVSAHPCY